MRKLLYIFLVFLTVFAISYQTSFSWGFFAHKRINRMAVFTLPPDMIGFYKKHIEFVTEHAVDPDKRRYAVKGEKAHHYIDIDHYSEVAPFDSMPRWWEKAVEKYTEDTLNAYGTLPWHIQKVHWRLTNAFKEEDINKILRYSADIGHYIGDSHVPLHNTENYNGQLTNQKGIHSFWESRLPELFAEEYDFMVGRAEYVENVLDAAWDAVEVSHLAVDTVLSYEAQLNQTFPVDKKYSYDKRGNLNKKVYSQEYADAYHQKLGGMVERRMRKAILTIGSLWYTAWVDAGQPDLSRLDEREVTKEAKKQAKQEEIPACH